MGLFGKSEAEKQLEVKAGKIETLIRNRRWDNIQALDEFDNDAVLLVEKKFNGKPEKGDNADFDRLRKDLLTYRQMKSAQESLATDPTRANAIQFGLEHYNLFTRVLTSDETLENAQALEALYDAAIAKRVDLYNADTLVTETANRLAAADQTDAGFKLLARANKNRTLDFKKTAKAVETMMGKSRENDATLMATAASTLLLDGAESMDAWEKKGFLSNAAGIIAQRRNSPNSKNDIEREILNNIIAADPTCSNPKVTKLLLSFGASDTLAILGNEDTYNIFAKDAAQRLNVSQKDVNDFYHSTLTNLHSGQGSVIEAVAKDTKTAQTMLPLIVAGGKGTGQTYGDALKSLNVSLAGARKRDKGDPRTENERLNTAVALLALSIEEDNKKQISREKLHDQAENYIPSRETDRKKRVEDYYKSLLQNESRKKADMVNELARALAGQDSNVSDGERVLELRDKIIERLADSDAEIHNPAITRFMIDCAYTIPSAAKALADTKKHDIFNADAAVRLGVDEEAVQFIQEEIATKQMYENAVLQDAATAKRVIIASSGLRDGNTSSNLAYAAQKKGVISCSELCDVKLELAEKNPYNYGVLNSAAHVITTEPTVPEEGLAAKKVDFMEKMVKIVSGRAPGRENDKKYTEEEATKQVLSSVRDNVSSDKWNAEIQSFVMAAYPDHPEVFKTMAYTRHNMFKVENIESSRIDKEEVKKLHKHALEKIREGDREYLDILMPDMKTTQETLAALSKMHQEQNFTRETIDVEYLVKQGISATTSLRLADNIYNDKLRGSGYTQKYDPDNPSSEIKKPLHDIALLINGIMVDPKATPEEKKKAKIVVRDLIVEENLYKIPRDPAGIEKLKVDFLDNAVGLGLKPDKGEVLKILMENKDLYEGGIDDILVGVDNEWKEYMKDPSKANRGVGEVLRQMNL